MSNQLIESCKKNFDAMLEVLKKKNSDYAGDADTYKNFIDPELQAYLDKHNIPLDAVELGIRIRLKDKWARINTLMFSDKNPSVIDESIEDTIGDVIGYCAIWKAWREFRTQGKSLTEAWTKGFIQDNSTMTQEEFDKTFVAKKWNDICLCGGYRKDHFDFKHHCGHCRCGSFELDPKGKEL